MTGAEWDEPRGFDHVFETGRKARLRLALPVSKLVRQGVWTDELAEAFDLALRGELADQELAMRLGDALVIGMFIIPRVVADPAAGESVPDGAVPISWLDETEINETVQAAFGGPAIIALFRGAAADEPVADDGRDVANPAVGAARPRAGKPRSARGGRSSGKPSA